MIGVARPRLDAPDKVTGATRYAADGYVHGLLHARLVLSTEAHALIRGSTRDAALAVPGVVAVLTADDLPIAGAGNDRTAEPLAREEVVFAGQPVAIVVAESEAAAEDGAEAVVVEYEPLDGDRRRRAGDGDRRPLAGGSDDAAEGSDLGSMHAGVDEGRGDRRRGDALGERPRHRCGAASGDVAARARGERRGRLGHVPDALGLPGVPRAAGLHGVARARAARSSSRRARRARS